MRIALITLDNGAAADALVLGQSVAQHQLEFAVQAGCDAVIVLGDPHSTDAFRVRHAAETYGIKFRALAVTHNLLGVVGSADEVIVFERDILPANEHILARLTGSSVIVTADADPAVDLGYERIDAISAWAGAMRLPGRLVEQLAQLPRDCEAAAALLRIALQAKVPSHPVETSALGDGSWQRVAAGSSSGVEGQLINRRLGPVASGDLTGWIANKTLRASAKKLFQQKAPAHICAAISAGLSAGAVFAALSGVTVAGLVAIALAAIMARVAVSLGQLKNGEGQKTSLTAKGLQASVDIALLVCGFGALDEGMLVAGFPVLILLALLHTLPSEDGKIYSRLFHDRAVLAVAFAAASLFGYLEPAIMGASLLLLGDAKYRTIKVGA